MSMVWEIALWAMHVRNIGEAENHIFIIYEHPFLFLARAYTMKPIWWITWICVCAQVWA